MTEKIEKNEEESFVSFSGVILFGVEGKILIVWLKLKF